MSEIEEARAAAEETLGFSIPEDVAAEVLTYARRKCSEIGKPDSYLPLLYENELTDYYMRLAVNLKGGMNRVHGLRKVAV